MVNLKKIPDKQLVHALRCCGTLDLGCKVCSLNAECTGDLQFPDALVCEAAERLEKLSDRLDKASAMILRLDDERRRGVGKGN